MFLQPGVQVVHQLLAYVVAGQSVGCEGVADADDAFGHQLSGHVPLATEQLAHILMFIVYVMSSCR